MPISAPWQHLRQCPAARRFTSVVLGADQGERRQPRSTTGFSARPDLTTDPVTGRSSVARSAAPSSPLNDLFGLNLASDGTYTTSTTMRSVHDKQDLQARPTGCGDRPWSGCFLRRTSPTSMASSTGRPVLDSDIYRFRCQLPAYAARSATGSTIRTGLASATRIGVAWAG